MNLGSGDKYSNKKWKHYYDIDEFDAEPKFGFFQVGSIIGVLLDIDRGTLHFFKDGYDLGQAFTSPELKEGQFYPFI